MDSHAAVREAEAGELKPFYLLVGEEAFLMRAALSALREGALRGGIEGLNHDQLDAGDASVEQALSIARTLPMLAPRRFVLLRNVERWEGKETKSGVSPLDRLVDYASAPVPSTVLVATAPKLDKRRRLYTSGKKLGFLVECDPLPAHELPRWVRGRAEGLGHPIAQDVAGLLAELCGPELSPVNDALERLSLYVGSGQPISEEALAECVVRVRPTTVWELVSAVGERNTGRALQALAQVYEPQDRGLRLLGVLAWQTRQLLKFESALRRGQSPQDAAKTAGAPPFKAKDLARQVKQLPREQLESWLPVLARIDLDLKGGSERPPKAILEHALIELCRG
jgi:DNA polymerase-3 subunit delta